MPARAHSAGVAAQPRPVRRPLRTVRTGQRHGTVRGFPVALGSGGRAVASLDAGRLAAAAMDSRTARPAPAAGPLEDDRQPAPVAGGALLAGIAGRGLRRSRITPLGVVASGPVSGTVAGTGHRLRPAGAGSGRTLATHAPVSPDGRSGR